MPPKQGKILHFIDSEGLYGAEQVILTLSHEMLRASRFEPIVGCIVRDCHQTSPLDEKARASNIQSLKLIINNKRFYLDIPALCLFLKKKQISLIHSHGYKPSVVGFVISLITGIPIIATCHLWYSGKNPPLRYRLMTLVERFFFHFFPKIVCVSEKLRNYLIAHGISSSRVITIPNGIKTSTLNKAYWTPNTNLLSNLGLNDDRIRIINIARLTEQKAQPIIIKAAQVLKNRGFRAHFLIVGEGEQREYLQSLIIQNGLSDDIRLLGFRSDVIDLLRLSDIFVLPSLDEGLPMSLLEAMASGIPVIATPVGDIPEVIQHNKEGLLIPVGDPISLADRIQELSGDDQLRLHLSSNASRKIELYYSSTRMSSLYHNIYSSLLSTR
jgi:glycosyltransferase involved in cell wall biosynthesis